MPGFLIPLLVAGAILVALGILLRLGAGERRHVLSHDDDLGNLRTFKTHWETATPKLFGHQTLSSFGNWQQYRSDAFAKEHAGFRESECWRTIQPGYASGQASRSGGRHANFRNLFERRAQLL